MVTENNTGKHYNKKLEIYVANIIYSDDIVTQSANATTCGTTTNSCIPLYIPLLTS